MTGKTARLIFWIGTLSSAVIFLRLTYDFHRQTPKFTQVDKLSDEVVEGKKVWHKNNCNDCHTILGFGGYYAPDMTKAFYRLGENNIVSIIMHPEEVYRNSFRKMPHLGVTESEAKQLVAFLKWVGTIDNRHWPPQDEKYVKAYHLREVRAHQLEKVDIVLGACGGCHSFENQGRNIAGDFSDIAKRRVSIEPGVVPRTGHRPHIDKPFHPMGQQQADEFFERPRGVTDGEDDDCVFRGNHFRSGPPCY